MTISEANRITEVVRTQLRSSSYAAVRRVNCFYDEGVLVLFGQVPSYHQLQLALAAVTGLGGVGRIVNRIRVFDDGGTKKVVQRVL